MYSVQAAEDASACKKQRRRLHFRVKTRWTVDQTGDFPGRCVLKTAYVIRVIIRGYITNYLHTRRSMYAQKNRLNHFHCAPTGRHSRCSSDCFWKIVKTALEYVQQSVTCVTRVIQSPGERRETVSNIKEELNINSFPTQVINGATGNRLPPNMPWMEHLQANCSSAAPVIGHMEWLIKETNNKQILLFNFKIII